MKYHWLNKENNKRLIVFFCGWSFDYVPFEFLSHEGADICVIYDYGDINSPEFAKTLPNLDGYEDYNLVSWSMGVYVAYLLKDVLPEFSQKVAVNGTPCPIDDELGIPLKTFDLTLKYVDTGLKCKFQKNLFKKAQDYVRYTEHPVQRSVENQTRELVELDKHIKNRTSTYEKYYDKAIISDTDKIIPTKNQINCWGKFAQYEVLDSGHFPFFEFESWDEILACKQIQKQ